MESMAIDLETTARTPLHAAHVDALREVSEVVHFEAGELVGRIGEVNDRFIYVLEGEIEALDPVTNERFLTASLGPGQFLGEISFLSGASSMLSARAAAQTTALVAPRRKVLDLMSSIPEMSDIIVSVFAGRRRRLLESNLAGLTIIGAEMDPAIERIAAFASRNRVPFRNLDTDDEEAYRFADVCGIEPGAPAVIFGRDQVVHEPTSRKVARLFGLDLCTGDQDTYDVLIVGGGPAGVAAGVYAGSEGLSALVVDDLAIGGQAGTSSRIENYMGFPTGISGADLCWRGAVQAMKFGTRFAIPRRVTALHCGGDAGFRAQLDDGVCVKARAVVVATGVQYRRLPIDGLQGLEGAGIYYAATEMEARYCRHSDAVVIGGGNSAGQAAMFLSRSAKHVHVLVRGRSLAASMSSYLSERLKRDPRISIHFCTEMTALHADERLIGIDVRDKDTGETRTIETAAVFVMVGAAPNTSWLGDTVRTNERGYICTGHGGGRFITSRPGVFAVGDVRADSVKRVASAVGEGSVVISEVWSFLHPNGA